MPVSQILFGSPGRKEQIPTVTPEVKAALQELLTMSMGGLREGQKGFEPIAKAATTRFQQETVPTLAERFTSTQGGPGYSGAFSQSLGQAGAGLQENLAALESQYGLQRQGQLQNLLGLSMTPQFETSYFGRQPGFAETAGAGTLQGLGQGVGQGVGALGTGFIGSLLSRLFGGGGQQAQQQQGRGGQGRGGQGLGNLLGAGANIGASTLAGGPVGGSLAALNTLINMISKRGA
jgi:hypothetical protein